MCCRCCSIFHMLGNIYFKPYALWMNGKIIMRETPFSMTRVYECSVHFRNRSRVFCRGTEKQCICLLYAVAAAIAAACLSMQFTCVSSIFFIFHFHNFFRPLRLYTLRAFLLSISPIRNFFSALNMNFIMTIYIFKRENFP